MGIKPEEFSSVPGLDPGVEPGIEIQELLNLVRPGGISSEQDYLLSWLSAKPGQMRSLRSMELDPEKRLETVLSALLKEPCNKVFPFKKARR